MNFVKHLFFLFLLFNSCLTFAETPFSVAAPLEGENISEPQDSEDTPLKSLLARLKQDAVILWMRNQLGDKASNFEKKVTPEFAESYILDYRVDRKGENKNIIQLSGHLDTDALKGWLRVSETKMASGSQLKLALVISFQSATELSDEQENNLFAATEKGLNQELKKLRLSVSSPFPPPFSLPPKGEAGISQLSQFFEPKGFNTVIWLHINQCATCPGARLDLYSYSLSQNFLMTALSEEVPGLLNSLKSSDGVNQLCEPFFKDFQKDFERAIAEGKTKSALVTLTIDGIGNYRDYKKLEYVLSQQSFWSDWVPKSFTQSTAQFEALSPLNASDVARRIEALSLSSGKLQLVRVDSRNVVMRYSR